MTTKYCHRCDKLVPPSHRHKAAKPRNARRQGYDAKWEQTRRQFLSAFPICQWHEGCLSEATDVHHRDGEGPKGERGHDWGNLQGLCHPHHSQLTAEMTPAGWNAPGYSRF